MYCLRESVLHNVPQRLYEFWRIIEAGAHLELRETELPGEMARFMIDLAESLNVIGNKSNRNDAHLADVLACEVSKCVG